MKRFVTISICSLNFVMSMVLILLLPSTVPVEMKNFAVTKLGSKWLGLMFAIVPLVVSLTTLIRRKNASDKLLNTYNKRDSLALVICYAWIIVGWVIFSINNSEPTIGAKVTLPYISLIILVVSLVISIFAFRVKDFNMSNKYRKLIFMWMCLVVAGCLFVLSTCGVIIGEKLVILIVDSAFVFVVALSTPLPFVLDKMLQDRDESLGVNENANQKFSARRGNRDDYLIKTYDKARAKVTPAKVKSVKRKEN